ncbi:lipoate--protein ligase family protein [bacterium]|nr:lipoate--protein ligase family protein [bacterium]
MTTQGTTWRFLDMEKGSAFFNMAFDEAVMHQVKCGASPPTFRVYGWAPPAITLGYSQPADEAVDFERCIGDGIDVTKRPTGGRAVYHDEEIAYAVVAPVDDPRFGGSIMESYSSVSRVLCDALNAVGVNASIESGRTGREAAPHAMHNPCFLSTSRYEITCGGKKIAGSAQRRFGTVFLQHGSILTGPGQEKIARYVRDHSLTEWLAEHVNEKSTFVKAHVDISFSDDMLRKSLLDAFSRAVDGDVAVAVPSREELSLAERLATEYYGSKGWILGYEKRTRV